MEIKSHINKLRHHIILSKNNNHFLIDFFSHNHIHDLNNLKKEGRKKRETLIKHIQKHLDYLAKLFKYSSNQSASQLQSVFHAHEGP